MKDHSENTLRAAIKCLRATVAPAVDPTDPQAVEQLRLTIDFLEFLRTRIYDIHPRQRYELGHQMALARALQEDAERCSPRAGEVLARRLAAADEVYDDPGAHTRDLQRASDELWAAVRALVREARTAPADVRARVGEQVMSGLTPLVELESAWYVPFGLEPEPDEVADLESLLPSHAASGQ